MKHVMIDLETMGNTQNSPVIAIGAVYFDPKTGETGEEFYSEISLESCQKSGLEPDASTILWWLKQSDEARSKFYENENALSLSDALDGFSSFMGNFYETKVWGNGISFDLGILSNAYSKIGKEKPWMFWNEMDVRTIVAFDSSNAKWNTEFSGVPHYALDDAKHQVKYLCEALKNVHP